MSWERDGDNFWRCTGCGRRVKAYHDLSGGSCLVCRFGAEKMAAVQAGRAGCCGGGKPLVPVDPGPGTTTVSDPHEVD